jgi:multidrug resistance efflux pump
VSQPNHSEPIGAVTLGRILLFGGSAWLIGSALTVWIGKPTAAAVSATLQAKTQSVVVSQASRLAELNVAVGEQVEPATQLFRLTDDRLTARIAAKRQQIVELKADVARAEAAAEVELEWRRRDLRREIFDTKSKAAQLQEARLHHQVEQIAWKEQLAGLDRWIGDIDADRDVQPLVLPADVLHPARLQAMLRADESTSTLAAAAAQIELCEQKLSELAALETKLAQKIRVSVGADVAQARLESAAAELADLEQQEQSLTIRSASHGVVASLTVQPGDALAAGQCVLELLDGDQRFLVAQVPSALVERFRVDDRVVVVFPQWQRFEGVVVAIPPQAQGAADDDDTLIPVRVAPCGKLWPNLPIGSRAKVELPRE